MMAGLERAVQSGDELRAEATLAMTAVALRRHRLEQGSYPANLGALVPVYLDSAPIDPFTGRPIDYETAGAGVELKAQVRDYSRSSTDRFTWSIPR
jgi:hypothetical protein